MRRKTFARMNCSIARALEIVGEWWSMLILREAFMGSRRFSDFQRNLGIARNILSTRLSKLTRQEILRRVPSKSDRRRHEYRLTEKGRALFPALTALRIWGDRWVAGPDRVSVKVIDLRSGKEVNEVRVLTEDGRPVDPRNLAVIPGPGATRATRARFQAVPKV